MKQRLFKSRNADGSENNERTALRCSWCSVIIESESLQHSTILKCREEFSNRSAANKDERRKKVIECGFKDHSNS